ncbi:hypothetical protein K4749_01205 [Streptomyces sp. TRM72054]|uniref:DUF6221 family protein n=1 Tax=Streptomyces sp. TRM72054 TaxID=2870562 RepID=UPI001C8B33FC|nr:DUF6221 family protein [Streptomyces sp. TRM72054]MBX9392248.1 hypothetical protein [Streptomyces sp. TRM72054]
MDDLVVWLGEQLDEDERIARAASWTDEANAWHAEPSPFGARDRGQRWYVEDAMDDGVVTHVDPQASDDEGVARHIAEHDPARVLREIDAKRQLVERYESAMENRRAHPDDLASAGALLALHGAVKLLALPYSDRSGYREEWRP